MSGKLWSISIAAIIVILLVALQSAEHWTLVEHAVEALKSQGPVGTFLANALMSRIFPLVLAVTTIVIVIDVWRKQKEHDEGSRRVEALKSAVPEANTPSQTIAAGGAATIGDIHIYPPTIPSPSLPVAASPQTDVRIPVALVKLTPSEGQSTFMFLAVENLGPKQNFRAQCRIVDRRNDPNPPRKVVLNLSWQSGGTRDMPLHFRESSNLVIAEADHDPEMEWLKILGNSEKPESLWGRGQTDNLPEYDLEISVFGDKSDTPHIEQFTIRPGLQTALEMYKPSIAIESPGNGTESKKRECLVKGSVTIPHAKVELRVFAGGKWHHNGYATVKGNSWERTCWFGDKDAIRGEYLIRAIANGNLDPAIKYPQLPTSGCQSKDVKVYLKRELTQPS